MMTPGSPTISTTRHGTQTKTFTKWVNAQLSSSSIVIKDLTTDFRDGTNLLALVRALLSRTSKEPLPLHRHLWPDKPDSTLRIHHIINVGKAMQYAAKVSGIPFQSLGPEDIVDGNEKMTLALIWGLIFRFQLRSITLLMDSSNPKSALLTWVKTALINRPLYSKITTLDTPEDFLGAWRSGRLFIALIHSICSTMFDFEHIDLQFILLSSTISPFIRLSLAFSLALHYLGVEQLLDPNDVAAEDHSDEISIMTYISSLCLASTSFSTESYIPFQDLLNNFISKFRVTIDRTVSFRTITTTTRTKTIAPSPSESADVVISSTKVMATPIKSRISESSSDSTITDTTTDLSSSEPSSSDSTITDTTTSSSSSGPSSSDSTISDTTTDSSATTPAKSIASLTAESVRSTPDRSTAINLASSAIRIESSINSKLNTSSRTQTITANSSSDSLDTETSSQSITITRTESVPTTNSSDNTMPIVTNVITETKSMANTNEVEIIADSIEPTVTDPPSEIIKTTHTESAVTANPKSLFGTFFSYFKTTESVDTPIPAELSGTDILYEITSVVDTESTVKDTLIESTSYNKPTDTVLTDKIVKETPIESSAVLGIPSRLNIFAGFTPDPSDFALQDTPTEVIDDTRTILSATTNLTDPAVTDTLAASTNPTDPAVTDTLAAMTNPTEPAVTDTLTAMTNPTDPAVTDTHSEVSTDTHSVKKFTINHTNSANDTNSAVEDTASEAFTVARTVSTDMANPTDSAVMDTFTEEIENTRIVSTVMTKPTDSAVMDTFTEEIENTRTVSTVTTHPTDWVVVYTPSEVNATARTVSKVMANPNDLAVMDTPSQVITDTHSVTNFTTNPTNSVVEDTLSELITTASTISKGKANPSESDTSTDEITSTSIVSTVTTHTIDPSVLTPSELITTARTVSKVMANPTDPAITDTPHAIDSSVHTPSEVITTASTVSKVMANPTDPAVTDTPSKVITDTHSIKQFTTNPTNSAVEGTASEVFTVARTVSTAMDNYTDSAVMDTSTMDTSTEEITSTRIVSTVTTHAIDSSVHTPSELITTARTVSKVMANPNDSAVMDTPTEEIMRTYTPTKVTDTSIEIISVNPVEAAGAVNSIKEEISTNSIVMPVNTSLELTSEISVESRTITAVESTLTAPSAILLTEQTEKIVPLSFEAQLMQISTNVGLLRVLIDSVAIDYPDIKERASMLESYKVKLAKYRAIYNQTVHSLHTAPSNTLISPEVSTQSSTSLATSPSSIPLPLSPMTPPDTLIVVPDHNACAKHSKVIKRALRDATKCIESAKHTCAVALVLQEFYQDYEICVTWLTDTQSAYDHQSKLVSSTLQSFSFVSEYNMDAIHDLMTTIRDLRTWISMINPHIIEFYSTFNALTSTSSNLINHFKNSSKYEDSLLAVETKSDHVKVLWDTLRAGFDQLKHEYMDFRLSHRIVQASDVLMQFIDEYESFRLNVDSDTSRSLSVFSKSPSPPSPSPYPSPVFSTAELSVKAVLTVMEHWHPKLNALIDSITSYHADTFVDVFATPSSATATETHTLLINAGLALEKMFLGLKGECSELKSGLSKQYQEQRHGHLVESWNSVIVYANESLQVISKLEWDIPDEMATAPSIVGTEIFAHLTNASNTVLNFVASVSSYHERFIHKLESSTATYLPDLATDQADQILGLQEQAMQLWKSVLIQVKSLESTYAQKAWVPDAIHALFDIETQLSSANDIVAIHAGKRKSRLSLNDMRNGDLTQAAIQPSTVLVDLANVTQSLMDVDDGLRSFHTTYREAESIVILKEHYDRLNKLSSRIRRTVKTISEHRGAAMRIQKRNVLVNDLTKVLAPIPTRLTMAKAELTAFEDPLFIKLTSDLTPFRSTITEANHALSTAKSMLFELEESETAHPKQETEVNARNLIQQTEIGITECSEVLNGLDSKLSLVKEKSNLLDEVERSLRLVSMLERNEFDENAIARDLEMNKTHIQLAEQTLKSISECPAVLRSRHQELITIQGLLSEFVSLSFRLFSDDILKANLLFSLDESQPNTIVPRREELVQLNSDIGQLQIQLDSINEHATEWITRVNKVITVVRSDEATIFSDILNQAKSFIMTLSILAAETMDQRNAASSLALRVIETYEQGQILMKRIGDDNGTMHASLLTEFHSWQNDSQDLARLFLPLQDIHENIDEEVGKSSDRAVMLAKDELISEQLNDIDTMVVPMLNANIHNARSALPSDMFYSEPSTVNLLQSTADDATAIINPIMEDLSGPDFAGNIRLGKIKEKLDRVNLDINNLREEAGLAISFVSAAAAIHSFTARIQVARDNLLADTDYKKEQVVTARNVEELQADALNLRSVNSELIKKSPTMASRLDGLDSQLTDLDEALALSIRNRELFERFQVFEKDADRVSQSITREHNTLSELLDARHPTETDPSTLELEKLDGIAVELESIKNDISELILKGSGHADLSKSVYLNSIVEREHLIQTSMSAVLQLHLTVKSTKQREYKEDNWNFQVSQLSSQFTKLLDQLKQTSVNLDTVDQSEEQLMKIQSDIDSASERAAVLKDEGQGDISALNELSTIVSRRFTNLQQERSECLKINELVSLATNIAEHVDACVAKVPDTNDLDQLALIAVDAESYEDQLRDLVKSQANVIISSKPNVELVQGLFSDLQKSITMLLNQITERREAVELEFAVRDIRTKADDFILRVRNAVNIPRSNLLAVDNFEQVPVHYGEGLKLATSALDELNTKHLELTDLAKSYMDKSTITAPLQLILTELLTEWYKACDTIKQSTDNFAAISSVSALFSDLAHIKTELERIQTVVQSVQANTTESSISVARTSSKDTAALEDEMISAINKYRVLVKTNASLFASVPDTETYVSDIQQQINNLKDTVHEVQTTLIKTSQLLASCAEMHQQCDAILETAEIRQATVTNELFYSMEPADAEKFVEAAFTVHQNTAGDVERLRAFRERIQTDYVYDQKLVSREFHDRIQATIRGVDSVLARMYDTTKKETDQIEVLKRVYQHMRSAQQILTWLNAARSALESLQNASAYSENGSRLQSSTVDEIRGKMVSFHPTIKQFMQSTQELVRIADHPIIRDRSHRIQTDWDNLDTSVNSLGQKVLVGVLYAEFFDLTTEMKEAMQSYRREIQIVSQNAERVNNNDEVSAVVTKLRAFSDLISEAIDPQVNQLNVIVQSDLISNNTAMREELSEHYNHITYQVKSLKSFAQDQVKLIQATKQSRYEFDILAEIKQLIISTKSILDEVHVNQIGLLDIDRTIAALQQRQQQFANNIERLFAMVAQTCTNQQVLARRDLLLEQWHFVQEDTRQIIHDLKLRKKVLSARSERIQEDRYLMMTTSSSYDSSRSFLPRPSTLSIHYTTRDTSFNTSAHTLAPGFSSQRTTTYLQTHPARPIFYRADPKDPLDLCVGHVVNELGIMIKITRLAIGKYLFGDSEGKVVHCRLVKNNTVMVRVGGGYKDLREFLMEFDGSNFLVRSETLVANTYMAGYL